MANAIYFKADNPEDGYVVATRKNPAETHVPQVHNLSEDEAHDLVVELNTLHPEASLAPAFC